MLDQKESREELPIHWKKAKKEGKFVVSGLTWRTVSNPKDAVSVYFEGEKRR